MVSMKATILLALVSAAAARSNVLLRPADVQSTEELAVTRELVERINANPEHKSSFKAGESEFFKGMTAREARKLMGTRMDKTVDIEIPVKTYDHIDNADIPASFDARTQWPTFIHPIRNQLQCGSCWAFAASEALSDRFAIASNGTINNVLSPEDMVSCDTTDMGCQGGYLQHAWAYLASTGIVTDSCFPYGAGGGQPPPCATKCATAEPFKKYKSKDAFQLQTVEDIQKAIMTDGPVEAGFTVYKSFMAYVSGVYQHHWWMFWDTVEGGHAIKIVGWGSQKSELGEDEDYWIIANSWSTVWGEKGFFKILRGTNECDIESQVFAGHADLSSA